MVTVLITAVVAVTLTADIDMLTGVPTAAICVLNADTDILIPVTGILNCYSV
jgi:hypothetical protein